MVIDFVGFQPSPLNVQFQLCVSLCFSKLRLQLFFLPNEFSFTCLKSRLCFKSTFLVEFFTELFSGLDNSQIELVEIFSSDSDLVQIEKLTLQVILLPKALFHRLLGKIWCF